MKKNAPVGLIVMSTVVAILLIAMIAMVWSVTHYVIVDWKFYPKSPQTLDLREQELTLEEYQAIDHRLPQSEIIWNVPLDSGSVSSDVTEITILELSYADVARMDTMPNLKTVHAEECLDYPQLLDLQSRHPEAKVLYNVTLGKNVYDQDAETVRTPELDVQQAALLQYLPKLVKVDAAGCFDYDLIRLVQEEHPEWEVTYTVRLGTKDFPFTAAAVDAAEATFEEMAAGIPAMPALTKLHVTDPEADSTQLLQLRSENPGLDIRWEVNILGQVFDDETTEVDISGITVEDTESVGRQADKLPKLEKLIMSDCGIENEEMAAFRESRRDRYKVVWTVYFSKKCKARTDETYFMPIRQGEYYFRDGTNVMNLQYCEDMVCVDVGDTGGLTNVQWAAKMPHLKWLIIANSSVRDISALSSCKELVYLEIDGCTGLTDYSPLIGCTALEDINLSRTAGKADPLCQMTWLKNLFWEDIPAYKRQMLTDALPDTRLVFVEVSTRSGLGWRNLPNYYAQRDYLGMYYMQ